jgi:signal transduction histidine kinase/ActR/RegA family two-component response regulator
MHIGGAPRTTHVSRYAAQSKNGLPPAQDRPTMNGSIQVPYLNGRVVAPLIALVAAVGALLTVHREGYSDLHTLLDTSMFLLSGMLALLLWGAGERNTNALLRFLAISFMVTSSLELLHALSGIEWSGSLEGITRARNVLRPITWPPAAYVLPIAVAWTVWSVRGGRDRALGFAAALVLLGAAILAVSYWIPRYSAPLPLGITRPTLIPVPLLWIAVAAACWRLRTADRLYPTLALMAAVLVLAGVAMLYSRAPHDTLAMVAHLGKVAAYLTVLLSLIQMASDDMRERLRAEQALQELNLGLEDRVRKRTAELESANENYRESQRKLASQVERLNLLDRITRAIGERQDLNSIYVVILRELEEHLQTDFGCVCSYEPKQERLGVACVGERSRRMALELGMEEGAHISIDENGLSRCIRGKLVYEPDISGVEFPFPQRLVRGDLRSLVIAPLQAESRVFGVLVVARRTPRSFSSGECEFLRQLSEHVALAASQAQTYMDLQQAYDDLRQTSRAVLQQERLRALGQMASGIAHDINNALSPVSLYTESLLEREPGLSERARAYLETIQRAIDNVGQTVARMREFYRPREAQLALARVELNALIRQVIDLTRARWSDLPQQRGVVIDVKVEFCPDLPATQGAENEIRDALTNLVFNAVDAMPEGGTLTFRTVAVGADCSGEGIAATYACVEVHDTGVGMDEETRRRCVEPFFTTKGERGTGLGLASVYGMVERHSGTLEIDSEPAHGTRVRLLFPASEPQRMVIVDQEALSAQVRKLQILIIDDDPVIIESLRNILQGDGHRVTAAEGGQAGIDVFGAAKRQGRPFDLVITDLGMPHVDGRKVAASIGTTCPGMPIILLTGWGQRLLDENDLPLAVHRVLAKPPKLRELRAALRELAASGPTAGSAEQAHV